MGEERCSAVLQKSHYSFRRQPFLERTRRVSWWPYWVRLLGSKPSHQKAVLVNRVSKQMSVTWQFASCVNETVNLSAWRS